MSFDLRKFDFTLPQELVAQAPVHPRDQARLLVYDRSTKQLTDDYFYNLNQYLPASATLVLNNSKVDKCRLRFGNVEIFILRTINPTTVEALVRPGKKFAKEKSCKVAEFEFTTRNISEDGVRTIRLDRPISDKSFDKYRLTPLPPYINQNEKLSGEYQTVYAKLLGSKAAPTAGLHFTTGLLRELKKSHHVAEVTLHVGLGTFAPLRPENFKTQTLHQESFLLDKKNAKILNNSKHLTAVGTTSVRVLESLNRPFKESTKATGIFITPGYNFRNVKSLITNFHLPKTSLIMLVAAFVGSAEETLRIYDYAIEQKYRFYSFGDAMLIL